MMKKNWFVSLVLLIISALFVSCGKDYAAVYFQNNSVDFDYSGKSVDENTVFELGSCGKTIAAYIAMALVQEGKLELNQKINRLSA